MSKNLDFIKKFFVPFVFMIVLLGSAAKITMELSSFIRMSLPCNEPIPLNTKTLVELGIISFFGFSIFLLRRMSFDKIFQALIWICSFFILSAGLILGTSQLSFFITFGFCFKVLMLLSWGYINQYTSFETSCRYYFLLNPFYFISLYFFPILPYIFQFSNNLCKQYFIFSAIAFIILSYCIHLWIQKGLKSQKPTEQNVNSTCQLSSYIGFGIILSGLFICSFVLHPLFRESVKIELGRTNGFSKFFLHHLILLSLVTLLFGLAAIYFGPLVLKKLKWQKSIYLVCLIAFTSLIPQIFTTQLWALGLSQIVLTTLQVTLIVPLVQIGFTSYTTQKRFSLQAVSYLVVFPMMMIICKHLKALAFFTTTTGLIMIILMGFCAYMIGRENPLLKG